MKNLTNIAFLFSFFLYSCGQAQEKISTMNPTQNKYTNQLIHESSPYLLQHAHNPVNWYPWGTEALEKAKKENKLILVSIGYAACHWCHVMEHECFEDEEVAQYMNEHFVSIKVDREERPDIDQIYMNALLLLTGSGGWPLNCIALPDGRPIYGGTYFPKANWLDVLKKVANYTRQFPDKVEKQAKDLTEGIKASELIIANPEKADFTLQDMNALFDNWKNTIDYQLGGFDRAPKFPLPIASQYLLYYSTLTQNEDALKAVKITLDKMSEGGIYDQVGGGFSRYSTDKFWKVPHFEKMLYDNSQLVSLYASAFQKTKNYAYKIVVEETLEFIERELTSKEGGFYSSLDADSEGEEGKFYTWTKNEIQTIIGKNTDVILDYYNCTEEGNWEKGVNILFKSPTYEKLLEKYKISTDELAKQVTEAKEKLLEKRAHRIRPGLDDKILTSWNALMLKGYVDAYRVFDKKKYIESALKNADFILTKLKTKEQSLFRNYKNGQVSINGFLDDYAFTIEAFISLYQATFDEKWLQEAQNLMAYALTHFFDNTSGMFFYTSDLDPKLIARKMEITDNVIPSSNSTMAKNLYQLGMYFFNNDYIDKSKKMLNNVKKNALKGASYFANWDLLMGWFVSEPYEVAIVGDDYEKKRKEFDNYYLPNVFFLGARDEGHLTLLKNKLVKGKTSIYVCQNKVCKFPTIEVKEALKQIAFK